MAADDQQVRQEIDAIVQAIGFGIVNDFRELRQAMYYANAVDEDNNRLVGEVNSNLAATERSLDSFEKEVYRRQDARAFRRIEDQLERRSKGNDAYNKDSLQRVYAAIDSMRAQIGRGGGGGEGFGGGFGTGGPNISVGGWKKAAVVGGVTAAAVGGLLAYNYFTGSSEQEKQQTPPVPPPNAEVPPIQPQPNAGQQTINVAPPPQQPQDQSQEPPKIVAPNVAPRPPQPATPQAPPPPPQASLARAALSATPMGMAAAMSYDMGAAAGDYFTKASTSSSVNTAKQTVGAITTSSTQRAANKVNTKVSNWLSANGGRIQNVIGAPNMQRYGQMIGGNFSFAKFLPGDAWTNIGAEYVAGVTPPIEGGTNEKYIAGVAVTLAIMTYLMCREIYTEENYVAIENGLVPNFDSLPQNERSQAVKNAGTFVETYVNSLISASAGAAASVGQAPSSPPAPISAPAPAAQPSAAGGGGGGGGAAPAGGASAPAAGPAGTGSPGAETLPLTPPDRTQGSAGREAGGEIGLVPNTPPDGSGSPASGLTPSSPQAASSQTRPNASIGPSDTMASVTMERGLESGDAGGVAEILQVGPGYNVVRLNDGSVVKRRGDRNWRNNNPGNMEYGDTARKYGAIGSDGRFAIFPDKETGNRARQALLFETRTYKDLSISQAIYKYAPPKENNTAAYIAQVSKGVGVSPSTRLSDLSPEQQKTMLEVMEKVEGFKQGQTQVLQEATKKIDDQQAQIDELKNKQTDLADKTAVKPLPDATVKPAPEEATQASDVTENLSPTTGSGPTGSYGFADNLTDEETSSMETQAYDARSRRTRSGEHPKDVARNKLPTYMLMLQHMFGDLTDEMQAHINGESSEDDAFEQAMHPL